jgi:multidrug efflux pump subunit AcrA (membrane-fusion protein)
MRIGMGMVLAALVLGGAGGGAWVWYQRAGASELEEMPKGALVQRGLLRSVIHATGPVVTRQDVPIKCKASGTVIKLPFDVSDRVKKGDVLLQLDTDDQDRAVKKAKGALEAAKAQLAQAKQGLEVAKLTLAASEIKVKATLLASRAKHKELEAKLERTRNLFAQKLVSQEELDTASTLVAVAESQIAEAEGQEAQLKAESADLGVKEHEIELQQANVDQCQVNLDVQLQQLEYATVRSPIDGVVANLVSGKDAAGNDIITRIGSVVQSGTANVSGGTTVMTISDHSRMFVYANVAESDIGRVIDPQVTRNAPQQVLVTADSYPGEVFSGHVVRVADQGTMNTNVVVFEVRIELDGAKRELLKPKMTANVEIIVVEKPDALLLPLGAFGQGETVALDGGGTAMRGKVNVVTGAGTVEQRAVTVGIADANHYEVLSGINEGERVLLNAGMDSKWQRMKLPGAKGAGGKS